MKLHLESYNAHMLSEYIVSRMYELQVALMLFGDSVFQKLINCRRSSMYFF
jgi:hypothetical protein